IPGVASENNGADGGFGSDAPDKEWGNSIQIRPRFLRADDQIAEQGSPFAQGFVNCRNRIPVQAAGPAIQAQQDPGVCVDENDVAVPIVRAQGSEQCENLLGS